MTGHKRTVVFYDDPCPDGAASAWVIRKAMREAPATDLSFYPLAHRGNSTETRNYILSHLHNGDSVFFVDTAPGDDVLSVLHAPEPETPHVAAVTIIDHHPTEIARLRKFAERFKPKSRQSSEASFDFQLDPQAPAACLMVWNRFFPQTELPRVLNWIGRIDRSKELRGTNGYCSTDADYLTLMAVSACIDSADLTTPEKIFASFDQLESMTDEEMQKNGGSIMAESRRKIDTSLRHDKTYATMIVAPDRFATFPVFNVNILLLGRAVNTFLKESAQECVPAGFAGAWYVMGDGSVKMSLRSDGIPNVGEIAHYVGRNYGQGGGGHETDAAIIFGNLEQFIGVVRLQSANQAKMNFWSHQMPAIGPEADIIPAATPARRFPSRPPTVRSFRPRRGGPAIGSKGQ